MSVDQMVSVPAHHNEVILVGRLSKAAESRLLPSGAELTQWRLAVRRPVPENAKGRADAIECVTYDPQVRDALAGLTVDDVIEVQGALRRRWWRGGSAFEVEALSVRLAHRAVVADAPSPRTPQSDPEDPPEERPSSAVA
ncbi:single-stranded DNA-binding protein [Herbidospora cretacea]|uniref:single-stranded DNA-binding protein n=1 Tax=Herbidospora cretacea TaxID=28444 RepID=UPI0009ED2D21|nr:single-stranded DNA-binding protein [Herbidospora cretacea]